MQRVTNADLWEELPPSEWGERHLVYRGLALREVADPITGEVDPHFRCVTLASGTTLLILLADEARAFEIASDLAQRRDWTEVEEWDGNKLFPAQIAAVARYPGEAVPPSSTVSLGDDWAFDIPYGD